MDHLSPSEYNFRATKIVRDMNFMRVLARCTKFTGNFRGRLYTRHLKSRGISSFSEKFRELSVAAISTIKFSPSDIIDSDKIEAFAFP